MASTRTVTPTKRGDGKSRRDAVQKRIRATFTGTRTFDRSLHKTNLWLKELMELMGWDNRERALSAMRATLHALRDVLPLEEVADLGAQLPSLVRGVYYEGWRPRAAPRRVATFAEFYLLVRENLGPRATGYSNDDLSKFTRACLRVVAKHVSAGEMSDIRNSLRRRLKDLVAVDRTAAP